METRRQQYRVPIDSSGLRVSIEQPSGTPITGELLDLSSSGAGVRIADDCGPPLAVGQVTDLAFDSEQFKTPLTVAARVQHRTDEPDASRYGFRFLQPQQIDARVPPVMREYFNRRRISRVKPDRLVPVAVSIEPFPEGPTLDGRMENISELGVGISVGEGRESILADANLIKLTIDLPGTRQIIEVVGAIRYRRLVGQRIYYGVEFDAGHSSDIHKVQSVIERYVIDRECDQLREAV